MNDLWIRFIIIIIVFTIFYYVIKFMNTSYALLNQYVDTIQKQNSIQVPNITQVNPNISFASPNMPLNIISEIDKQKLLNPLEDARGRAPADQVPSFDIGYNFNIPTQGIPDIYHRVGLLIANDMNDKHETHDKYKTHEQENKNNNNINDKKEENNTSVKRKTNYKISKFKQVREGFSTQDNSNDILELMGKKITDNWYRYFTSISKGNKIIKINIDQRNKRELLDGDQVFIPELGRNYIIQLDQLEMLDYNPNFY